jgi:hypothetical protein
MTASWGPRDGELGGIERPRFVSHRDQHLCLYGLCRVPETLKTHENLAEPIIDGESRITISGGTLSVGDRAQHLVDKATQ